jgi:ribosomal 50S subunit-associated protein YjgA (DUF615 family)
MEAKRRQLQYVGKIMRSINPIPSLFKQAALDAIIMAADNSNVR